MIPDRFCSDKAYTALYYPNPTSDCEGSACEGKLKYWDAVGMVNVEFDHKWYMYSGGNHKGETSKKCLFFEKNGKVKGDDCTSGFCLICEEYSKMMRPSK